MFPLHIKTRRFICRAAFLIFGVVPLAAAVSWAAVVNSAGHLSAVREQLADRLGMAVSLNSVVYPQPGVMLLEGLQLRDPDTDQVIATVRTVQVEQHADHELVVLSQGELNIVAAGNLNRLVNQALRPSVDTKTGDRPIRIIAGDLIVRWPGGVQTLTDTQANIGANDNAKSLSASFHLANLPMPLKLQIERTSESQNRGTKITLDTGDAPLPCSLLCAVLNRDNRLGPQSTLRGKLQASEMPDGWQAEFVGQLEQIDLNAAITDQFPHQLSGMATLDVKHAVVHAGRLEQFQGTVQAGPGIVSSSLVAAAAEMLGMRREFTQIYQPPAADGRISYEALAADLRLENGRLIVNGRCGGKTGIVLRGKDGTILSESTAGPVSMVALVKMLVPDSRVQVPATRQTDWLLKLLPIPDIVPHDSQASPHAWLHGHDFR